MNNGTMQTNAQQLALRAAAYAVNNFPSERSLKQYERVVGKNVTQSV